MSSSTEIPRSRIPPEPVRITNWPIQDEGPWSWLTAGGLAAVALLAGAVSTSLLMGIAVFVALALSVWRLWVPVTFEFNSRGVTQDCWGRRRRIPWIDVAHYEVLSSGVLLSADRNRVPLAPLRSICVQWHGQRNELLNVLEFFVSEEQAESPQPESQPEPPSTQEI